MPEASSKAIDIAVALQGRPPGAGGGFLLQEDGTSLIVLEDGTSFLLLE